MGSGGEVAEILGHLFWQLFGAASESAVDAEELEKLTRRHGEARCVMRGDLHEGRFRWFSHQKAALVVFRDAALLMTSTNVICRRGFVEETEEIEIPFDSFHITIKESIFGPRIQMKNIGGKPGKKEKYIFFLHKVRPKETNVRNVFRS